jgi:hypothetical protein
MRSRAARHAGLMGALMLGTGCYSYVPSTAAPAAGAEVAVFLTDRGRAAVGDRVGPEMDQLRGRLLSSSSDSLIIAMLESVTLRGESTKWGEERIAVNRDHIGSIRTKQFSRARSSIVAGSVGAATVVFVVASGLGIGGRNINTDPSTPPVPPGPSSRLGSLIFPFRSDF